MQVGSEVVKVDFIMVNTYFSYTAIVARPWFQVVGAIFSTLHLKVKYPSEDQIEELVGIQFMARQCLVVAIMHQPETESSTSTDREDCYRWWLVKVLLGRSSAASLGERKADKVS